jgi:hypothetical protein
MTMQNNIDIIRRIFRRNMNEPELQTFAGKIDNQGPVGVPIAIAAHHGQRRTDRFQVQRDRRFANITQMPNLIRIPRKIDDLLRQLVMSVGYDQDAHCIPFRTADGADNADITSAPGKIIRLNPRNPRLVLPCVI